MSENTKLNNIRLLMAFLCTSVAIVNASYRYEQIVDLFLNTDTPTTQLEEKLFLYMQPTAKQVDRHSPL
mgnify:CR=1 FL=1